MFLNVFYILLFVFYRVQVSMSFRQWSNIFLADQDERQPVHLLRILQWWGKTTKGPIRAVASIYSWGGGMGGGCRPKISE